MKNQLRHFDIGPNKKIQAARKSLEFSPVSKNSESNIVRIGSPKWRKLLPFASTLLLMAIAVQILTYFSSAKGAQNQILGAATSAYDDLSAAQASLAQQNFTDAQSQFSDALLNLQSAQDKLNQFKALQFVASQANSASHVLTGASMLAAAGQRLTQALSLFGDIEVASDGVQTENLKDKLVENRHLLTSALDFLNQAKTEFERVQDIPDNYAETLAKAKIQVAALTSTLQKLSDLEEIYLGFFASGPKTYLLIFQNYDEVRATGGFIGTYGALKVDDGKIQNLKIDSIYNLDGRIFNNLASPGPFQPFIKKWGIRDANWFADFPTSARKLLQFYESGSETADGVIAFTPAMFQDLLSITGPIEMKKYGVTLTTENFQEIVQYKTSVDYDKKLNQPKQLLADFAPMLLDRLKDMDQKQWLSLLQIVQSNLDTKQVLLYSKDPKLAQTIERLKVSGNILPSDHDFLMIVNSNMGGTKTDLNVGQKASLQGKIMSDGSIMDTLSVERANTAAVANKVYMRILVPYGSTLISSEGFDAGEFQKSEAEGYKTDPDLAALDGGRMFGSRTLVTTESGKTEFAGWMEVQPGETKTVKLSYMIPTRIETGLFKEQNTYSLLFQKQSGVMPFEFHASLDTGGLESKWISEYAEISNGKIEFKYSSRSDQYWAVLFSK